MDINYKISSIFVGVLILLLCLILSFAGNGNGQTSNSSTAKEIPGSLFDKSEGIPLLVDPKLKVEVVAKGLEFPTTIAFLGNNDILVLEKSKGTVTRITNGIISPEPLLRVNVAAQVERGMLGIAVSKNDNSSTYVFLYSTEVTNSTKNDNKGVLSNRVYRYELVDNKLVNPKLLLDLPATPGPRHNGGAITIGNDSNLYVPIGDVDGHTTEVQNIADGGPPDGTGGIIRITQDGLPAPSIIGDSGPAKKYYAYGIRNSFGLDFDPLSGKLWDTENGAGFSDEINLVEPGFNSGWLKLQGKAPPDFDYSQLVNFDGKGKYRDPELTWVDTVGPTKIKFFTSDKLGKEYENDMFVSDVHHGRIYHFDLNEHRDGLILPGRLADKVVDTDAETNEIIFGSNFGGISDMAVGPDGYLYLASLARGTIYRVVPAGDQ
jgi:glucose/arabinose dehydrogenase